MKCTDCKKDIAQIPYIEHELRMYKAYKRKNILKGLLVASNLIWSAMFAGSSGYGSRRMKLKQRLRSISRLMS